MLVTNSKGRVFLIQQFFSDDPKHIIIISINLIWVLETSVIYVHYRYSVNLRIIIV